MGLRLVPEPEEPDRCEPEQQALLAEQLMALLREMAGHLDELLATDLSERLVYRRPRPMPRLVVDEYDLLEQTYRCVVCGQGVPGIGWLSDGRAVHRWPCRDHWERVR